MKPKSYPEFSSRYPLLLTTFMHRPLRLYPDEIGVVYRNPDSRRYLRLTWSQWYERTCRLASALLGPLGTRTAEPGQPGDRVATMALNHHRHLELYYAAPCVGAVLHPINMRLSPEHIVHTIRHSGDRILFFDDVFLPLLEGIYDEIKAIVKKFVYLSDEPGRPRTRLEPLYEYEELLGEQASDFRWPVLDEHTHATLCYSTATTGLPKGVMFTHRQLYLFSLHVLLGRIWNSDPAVPRLDDSAVAMINTPLFHIHGWGIPFMSVFAAQKTVMPGRFTVEGFCELVQTEKVTTTGLVPTALAMLLEYEDLAKYDLSSLEHVSIGGAALPLGLKTKAEKMIPGFTAMSGYGMTETAPTTIASYVKKSMRDLPKEELDEVRAKTGLPMPGLEVEVVDEAGRPVPRDHETVGEIVMRGPWVMEQYYRDSDKTADVWRNGWFHTGDVAKVDEHGYITIVDRASDMIRSGSEMVPTVLLENLTATADFVLEATYVGVPDPKWGERPMALVKLTPGATHNEEDILDFLDREGVARGKITRWMLPDFIVVLEEIPKTSVGKFDKRAIKDRLEEFLSRAKRMGKPRTSGGERKPSGPR